MRTQLVDSLSANLLQVVRFLHVYTARNAIGHDASCGFSDRLHTRLCKGACTRAIFPSILGAISLFDVFKRVDLLYLFWLYVNS